VYTLILTDTAGPESWNPQPGSLSEMPTISKTKMNNGDHFLCEWNLAEIPMYRDWLFTYVMAVVMLSSVVPDASAQDSFLQPFKTVSGRDSARQRITPEFLNPNQSDSRIDNLFVAHEESNQKPYELQSDESSPVQSVSYPADVICAEELCTGALEFCTDKGCAPTSDCEIPLTRFRKSCYQGSYASYGTLGDDPDLGIMVRTLDSGATFAIPLGSTENVITFTPYIRADLLDAAAVLDVPESLFDTGVKMFWRHPINERLSSMMLITPSVRSDFTTSDGAFRLFGLALLTWQWVPQKLSISGGVVHTGRDDFPILPAMGLLWTPSPEWKVDAQFPSPRISHRLAKNGGQSETWAYLSGVFGGNTWAVTRTGGETDELTISDLRLVTGIEFAQSENRGFYVEAGYVFNRSMEYTTIPIERDLDAAMMMRAGVSF